MAGKAKSVYICSECGYESPKWFGCCPGCGVAVTNVARYCPECGARLPKGTARREAAV